LGIISHGARYKVLIRKAYKQWLDLQEMNYEEAKTASKRIIGGSKNIKFAEMIDLVEGFGFQQSPTDGSHHIFTRPDIPELVNL